MNGKRKLADRAADFEKRREEPGPLEARLPERNSLPSSDLSEKFGATLPATMWVMRGLAPKAREMRLKIDTNRF